MYKLQFYISIAVLLPVLSRLLIISIYTTFFDFASFKVRNLNCWSGSEGQYASSFQMLCRSVKRLPRYGHFWLFRMAAAAINDFYILNLLMVRTVKRANCVTVPNFVEIARTAAEIWRFFDFFPRRRPSAILDLWCVCWDQPRRAFGGLYHHANFAWNLCSSFDNMHVFRFLEFGLKMHIHTPKLFFDILKGEQCEQIPKRHILKRVRLIWAIMRENPSTGLTCRRVPQKEHK